MESVNSSDPAATQTQTQSGVKRNLLQSRLVNNSSLISDCFQPPGLTLFQIISTTLVTDV